MTTTANNNYYYYGSILSSVWGFFTQRNHCHNDHKQDITIDNTEATISLSDDDSVPITLPNDIPHTITCQPNKDAVSVEFEEVTGPPTQDDDDGALSASTKPSIVGHQGFHGETQQEKTTDTNNNKCPSLLPLPPADQKEVCYLQPEIHYQEVLQTLLEPPLRQYNHQRSSSVGSCGDSVGSTGPYSTANLRLKLEQLQAEAKRHHEEEMGGVNHANHINNNNCFD